MNRMVKREVRDLFENTSTTDLQTIQQEDIADLPQLVQNYLEYAGVIGKEQIRTVRLRQDGKFRQKPGADWLPMKAEQYYNTDSIEFVWLGKIKMNPLMSVTGRDKYLNGEGNMLIKLWSLIKVADAKGPEVNLGELLRYLGEIAWFPSAFLSQTMDWKTVDEHTVQVTLTVHNQSAGGEFIFNDQGQITQFRAKRYYEKDGEYLLQSWGGVYDNYQEINGWKIPTHAVVTWHLPEGDYRYFDGTITDIQFNVPESY